MKKRQSSLEGKKHYYIEIVDLDTRSYTVGDALSFKFAAEDEAESKAKEMFGEGNIQKKSPGTLEDTTAIAVYVSASSPGDKRKVVILKIPGEHYYGCPTQQPVRRPPGEIRQGSRGQRRRSVKSPG